MEAKIISLDTKNRIAIPTADRAFFRDGIVFWSMRINSLLLSNSSFEGVGVGEQTIDSGGRISISKDLIRLTGVPSNDPNISEILWITVKNKELLQFLLFFGDAGKQSWLQLLKTKEAISPLVLA